MNSTFNVLRVKRTSVPLLRSAILCPYSEQHFNLLAPAALGKKKTQLLAKMAAAISADGGGGWVGVVRARRVVRQK